RGARAAPALLGPGKVDFENVERLLAAGQLGGDVLPHALADQRARQRRQDGDAPVGRVGRVGSHDPVTDLLAALVLEPDGGGARHAIAAARSVDDLGPVDLALEVVDAALDERLLLTRSLILRVFRD